MRRALLVLVVLVVAGPAEASPRGLRIVGTAGTVTPSPVLGGPSTVQTDLAGDVFVVAFDRISAFNADGTLRAAWSLPGPLAFDALPDGTLFAAPLFGAVVHRFDASGVPLGSWGGGLHEVWDLAADPRGTVLIADNGPEERARGLVPKRYFPDGRFLGRAVGPGGTGSIAADGTRWIVSGTTVIGVTPSGRTFQQLARDCPIGHTPPGFICASGLGAFGGTPPTDIAAAPDGRLATLEAGLGRVQLFTRSGRVLFACERLFGSSPVTAIAFDRASRDILVAAGWTVYRARVTSARVRGCRRSPLRIMRVRVGHKRRGVWPISYRLSRRARVQLLLTRSSPGTVGRRAPSRRGLNRVHVNDAPGRWYFQLKAVDAATNSADTPLIRLRAR